MLTGPEAIAAAGARPLPIYLEGRLIPLQDAVSKELGLSLHQVVRGVVEVRAEGNVLLLNGKTLDLPAQLRFRPGEEIWLRMLQTGKGPALQVTHGPVAPAGQPATPVAQPLPPALAGVSPSVASLFVRPTDLGPILQLLVGTSVSSTALGQLGPLGAWLQARMSATRITPDGIRQAVVQSGLFTESRMAQRLSVQSDFKILLLEILRAMEEDPDDLGVKHGVEQALREIQSSQADTLVSASHRELLLSFVIPFRDAPPVQIRFFRQRRTEEEPDPPFCLDLHTESPDLGALWLSGALYARQHLELTMWAEREEVAKKARAQVDDLRGDLEDAGLMLKKMNVLHGRRPASLGHPPGDQRPHPGSVLDLSA
jgi:hypothetical protein